MRITELRRIHLMYAIVGIIITAMLSLLYISYLQYKEGVRRFTLVQSHLEIVHAANELSSYVKRAEGHMLMYLILHNQSDRDKFYLRHKKMEEIHQLLSEKLKGHGFQNIVKDMNTNVAGLLRQGNILLEATDRGESLSSQSKRLRAFHTFSSEIRSLGVGLVGQLTKELATYNNNSSSASYRYLVYLMLLAAFILVLLLLVLIYAKKFVDAKIKAEEMECQFQQSQKMEALGTLVGGIAHDFNNMLAGSIGNVYLAKNAAKNNPIVIEKLKNIESISFRAADMIKQLLAFARKGSTSMEQLSLASYIKETLKLIRISVPENIQMHQEVCSDDLLIVGDATQLHQVLLNIITNARDAIEGIDNPCITVKLEPFQANDAFVEKHIRFRERAYAHLSLEDNGCGISADKLTQLFEPFFTTKEQGKGTGLGLAMVFGAIQSHQGLIEVESTEGKGSTFHIYIPLLEHGGNFSAPSEGQAIAQGDGETILLVDDERHVLETGQSVLVSLGYHVLTAMNGREAIEVFKTHAEKVDLCILDVVMPSMGGWQAAKSIREIDPEAKVIFSTGYDKDRQADIENETLLSKPFSIEAMSNLIREKLNS